MQIIINDHGAATPNRINVEAPKLRDFLQAELKRLLQRAASAHGSSPSELCSRMTARNICRARGEFAYLALMELGIPIRTIGRFINRTNHEAIRISIAAHCERKRLPYPVGFKGSYWLERRTKQVARRQKARQ